MFINGLSGRVKQPFYTAPAPRPSPSRVKQLLRPSPSNVHAAIMRKGALRGLSGWGSFISNVVRTVSPPFIPQPPMPTVLKPLAPPMMPGTIKPKDILKASKDAVKKTTAVVKKVKAPILKATKKTIEVHKKIHAPLVKITKEVSKPAVKIYRKTAMPILKKAAPILSKIAPLLAFIPAVGWVVYLVYATYVAQAYQAVSALKAQRAAKKEAGAMDAEIAALDAEIAASERKLKNLENAKKSDDPYLLPPGKERDEAIAKKAADDKLVASGLGVREHKKNPLGILAAVGAVAMFLL